MAAEASEQEKIIIEFNPVIGGGEIPEAPADGKTYGRKNRGWSEVSGDVESFDIDALPQEDNIADGDEMPFHDVSASEPRKTTWQNIKAKLRAVFDSIYQTKIDSSHKLSYNLLNDTPVIPSVEGLASETYVDGKVAGKQDTISDLSTIRSDAAAGKQAADDLGGHTVAKDVPADAVFTDTVYDDTALKGRVTTVEGKVATIEGKEGAWDAKYDKPVAGIPESDLSDSVKAQLNRVFVAVYGTTSQQAILDAYDAGKHVICFYNNRLYSLYVLLGSTVYLSTVVTANIYYVSINSSDTWSNGTTNVQTLADLRTTWQETPDDTHYPSEKLVKDSLDGKQDVIDVSHKLAAELIADPVVGSSMPVSGFAKGAEYDLETISADINFLVADGLNGTRYFWTFDTPATVPLIVFPSGIEWAGGSAPTLNASKHYEVTIRNGYATILEFDIIA